MRWLFYSGKIPIMESKERPSWQDGVFVYQKMQSYTIRRAHEHEGHYDCEHKMARSDFVFIATYFITFTTRFVHLRAYDMPFLRMYLWL